MQTKQPNSAGHLNHPEREEWMDFLYGELPAQRRSELSAHLKSCSACEAEVSAWRTALDALDEWKLPTRRSKPSVQPAAPWKWAMAAAFVFGALGIGFGFGRMTSPTAANLRAEIKAAVETQFRQTQREALAETAASMLASTGTELERLLTEYAKAAEEKRVSDQQALLQTIQQLDGNRRAEILALRKDLETVALYADDSLQKTEQQLFRLATYSQPANQP